MEKGPGRLFDGRKARRQAAQILPMFVLGSLAPFQGKWLLTEVVAV